VAGYVVLMAYVILLGGVIFGLWNYSQPVWLALACIYVGSGILIRVGGIVRRRFRPSPAPPAPERQVG